MNCPKCKRSNTRSLRECTCLDEWCCQRSGLLFTDYEGVRATIARQQAVIAAQAGVIEALEYQDWARNNHDDFCIHCSGLLPDAIRRLDSASAKLAAVMGEAESHRMGLEPDPDYGLPAAFTTRFAAEYAKKLNPKEPRPCFTCPECGWEGEEDI